MFRASQTEKKSETETTIARLEALAAIVRRARSRSDFEELARMVEHTSAREYVILLGSDPSDKRNRNLVKDALMDGWGRQIRIEWRKDVERHSNKLHSVDTLSPGDRIVLWSIGQDGRDDYGFGDDIQPKEK